MCWVHEQPGEAWFSLATIAEAEKDAAMACGGSRKEWKDTLKLEAKVEPRGKVLIEEVQWAILMHGTYLMQ